MKLIYCEWCNCSWNPAAADTFALHESRCAMRIECPRCGAQPRSKCFAPGGTDAATHAMRERKARYLAGANR